MQKHDLKTILTDSKKNKFISFVYLLYRTELQDPDMKIIQNFLTGEAAKRKLSVLDFIGYVESHRAELIKLLEDEIPGQLKMFDIRKYPKFKKTYSQLHKEMENITHQLFKTRKLKDKGMYTIDEESITGEVKIWEGKGVEYIVKAEDLLKLDGKNPKVYVTQVKNLLLLMSMIQEQQFDNSTKEAKCEFTLSYYASRRGYKGKEIARGGDIFNQLRRDLFSGAYTTYRIKEIMIEGKEYTIHNTFYGLYEPKDHEINWKVEFNNPYGRWILEILNKEARQYFIINTKAIEDRKTTDKPYLFLFYQQLVKRKRKNLLTTPVKIGNLLKDMQIDGQILARPKECFGLLKACLIYFSENYQPTPEIEQFFLYNDFHKTETVKLPLSISEAFKEYSYTDFKDLLAAIGIKDIREAYISFKRPYKQEGYKLDEEENRLLDRTLKWFNGQVTKISTEDQESMIKMYIGKLGYNCYKELLEKEANKLEANAVEFLTKVLPDKLREYSPDSL